MKYGVIVCPKCKQVKGVELKYKSTKCNKCTKSIILEKIKVIFKTNSKEELIHAIGLTNAELEGRKKDFKKIFEKNI